MSGHTPVLTQAHVHIECPQSACRDACPDGVCIGQEVNHHIAEDIKHRDATVREERAAAAKRADEAGAELLQEEQAAAEAAQRVRDRVASKRARQKQRRKVCGGPEVAVVQCC